MQDFKSFGKKINHEELRGTVRGFLKAFMTKDLAIQFSWTRMGAGRKKTKKAFRDCSALQTLKGYFLYNG